jgi:endoglucanase
MKVTTLAVVSAAFTLASIGTAQAALPFVGTNLSGAEWNVTTSGVNIGGYHVYPDPNYVPGYDSPSIFAAAGMTIFRFPIDWENVQPTLDQPFDPAEFQKVTTTVSDLTALGVVVIIDLHNYARYGGNIVGSAQVPNSSFADFWSRMAAQYAGNPRVAFDLMNEPHDMPTEQWASAANAAIAAIRSAGATNLLFVEGNGWTGADSWAQDWYGTPDSTVMLTITDPANNYLFEAHQYLDPQSDGSSDTCASTTIGSQRMQPFTDWLRQNGKRGFLGEFNGGANATCYAALTDLLTYLDSNADVYLGWTWWASGPEWGSSPRVLEPGRDDYAPYMAVLQPFFPGAGTGGGTTLGDAGPTVSRGPLDAGLADEAEGGSASGGEGGSVASAATDASTGSSGSGQDASAAVLAADSGAVPGEAGSTPSSGSSAGCTSAPGGGSDDYVFGAFAIGIVAAAGRRSRRLRSRTGSASSERPVPPAG